jgi:hypothetical protein
VGARELRRDLRFSMKARKDLGMASRLGAHELDGDRAPELEVRRRDDDPHAAGAKDALDPVLAVDYVARANRGLAVEVADASVAAHAHLVRNLLNGAFSYRALRCELRIASQTVSLSKGFGVSGLVTRR